MMICIFFGYCDSDTPYDNFVEIYTNYYNEFIFQPNEKIEDFTHIEIHDTSGELSNFMYFNVIIPKDYLLK